MKPWIAKRLALPALLSLLMTACSPTFAVELIDDYHKRMWCHIEGGAMEYVLPTMEFAGCLTATHAGVFEFASNWDKALGQALYLASISDKLPAVYLLASQTADYHVTKLRQATQGLDVRIALIDW